MFEANGIFDNFDNFEQTFQPGQKKITRISHLEKNLETGWTYDWHALYRIEEGNETTEIEDITTLRAFTKDEILLFLKLTGFSILEVMAEEKVVTLVTES